MVIGVVGSMRRHTVYQLSARGSAQRAWCTLCNKPNRDAKAWFPALSPGHHTLTYADDRCSDYITAFHFARCLLFQYCSHVTHDIT